MNLHLRSNELVLLVTQINVRVEFKAIFSLVEVALGQEHLAFKRIAEFLPQNRHLGHCLDLFPLTLVLDSLNKSAFEAIALVFFGRNE